MYVSIDLGGTNTRLAVSTDKHTISKKVRFPTKDNFKDELEAMRKEIDNLAESSQLTSLCIGVPGFVDYTQNKIQKVINVPYLTGFDPSALVSGARIYVANDAALGGLGEAVHGVGQPYETVAYITLSTGVGGARISNKRIDTTQKHSEPGHIIVSDSDKPSVLTSQVGSWDSLASGVNFLHTYGIHPKECSDLKIWEKYGVDVARGLMSIVALWAPDVIVLGGSMAEKFGLFEDSMNKSIAMFNSGIFELPPILKSTLGHDNGLLGGFAFINQVEGL